MATDKAVQSIVIPMALEVLDKRCQCLRLSSMHKVGQMPKLTNQEIHSIHQQVNSLKSTMAAESMKMNSMKVYDTTAIQNDIDQLEAKIALHDKEVLKEKQAESKAKADSAKLMESYLDRVYEINQEMQDTWSKIHPSHRGRITDLKSALGRTLRNYKPEAKKKKGVA